VWSGGCLTESSPSVRCARPAARRPWLARLAAPPAELGTTRRCSAAATPAQRAMSLTSVRLGPCRRATRRIKPPRRPASRPGHATDARPAALPSRSAPAARAVRTATSPKVATIPAARVQLERSPSLSEAMGLSAGCAQKAKRPTQRQAGAANAARRAAPQALATRTARSAPPDIIPSFTVQTVRCVAAGPSRTSTRQRKPPSHSPVACEVFLLEAFLLRVCLRLQLRLPRRLLQRESLPAALPARKVRRMCPVRLADAGRDCGDGPLSGRSVPDRR